MKISKLLVLSALWLFGLGASAQYEQREEPTSPVTKYTADDVAALDKTPQEFVVGDYYVLYNKDAGKYFTEGNAWGTQASAGATPLLVRFTLPDGKKLEDAALLFNDYAVSKDSWKLVFFDSETAMFVDRGSQANYFWQVVPAGDKTYRLQASPANPSLNPTNNKGYVGIAANATGDTPALSPFLTTGKIDWQFFAAPGWKEYLAAKEVYDKSEELRRAIDQAADADIDANVIANAIDVYENLESTIEQMEAQIQAIMAEINGVIGEGASASNPVDVTALLQNHDYADGQNTSWSGNAATINYGSAELFNKNYTHYQTVKGARAGVYALKVRGYYRPGSTKEAYDAFQIQNNRNAKLYAKTAGGEVRFPLVNQFAGATEGDEFGLGNETANVNEELYVPNTMNAAATYFDEEWNENATNYDNTLFFVKGEGDMDLGVQKSTLITNDWTIFRNWSLEYYGNEADALQLVFANTKAAYELPETQYVITAAYLQQFENTAPAANTAEAIAAALNTLEELYDTLTTNAQLWLDLDVVADAANALGANTALDPAYTTPLVDWANNVFELKGQRALTNAELRALIAQKQAQIEEAKKHVIAPNTDMTDMLTNPDYENGATGWSGSPVMGSGGGNTCAEAYNRANFDIYQEVQGAPKGLYSIEVQGFFRLGRPQHENSSTNSWVIWEAGQQVAPAFVYLNDVQTALKCIYEEENAPAVPADGETNIYTQSGIDAPGNGKQYPNTMEQAAQAFAAGLYKSRAYGLVLNDGDQLRIGVKGSLDAASAGFEGANWAIWDNFKLTWVGYEAQYIKPVLEEQMGIYQALLANNMGKTAYATLSARLAEADAAAKGTDGKAMFDALGNLLKTDSLVRASIAKFVELANANEELADALTEHENTASAAAISAAKALSAEIEGLLPAHSIEDADVDAYVVKVDEAISALRVPDLAGATDENPLDATSAINNPGYDVDNSGWKGTAAARNADYANAELFSKNYNYYQDLVGLPEGTYELSVQGFYRYGLATLDYDSLGVQYTDHAFLYAASQAEGQDTVFFAKPLVRLATGASDWTYDLPADRTGYAYCATDSTEAQKVEAVDDNGDPILDGDGNPTYTWEDVLYRYVANTMATAADEFYDGKYMDNSIIVKVPANGRLRIGLMKTTLITNDWTLFDNWTLTCFGNASTKQADVNTEFTSVENVATAPVALRTELFTLDGRRINSLQKGIVIVKTTMSNGNIVVKKVRK